MLRDARKPKSVGIIHGVGSLFTRLLFIFAQACSLDQRKDWRQGIGQVEAPRGTLIHHYQTDERGLIKSANLIVATQNNSARIVLSVDKVARNKIKGGQVDDGILNMIEMAFRAYDPCHACATHSLQSGIPLMIRVYNCDGVLVREIISE